MANHYHSLNTEKALIWRIVHRDNLPWILDNGLHCGNSAVKAPMDWVNIGNPELIDKRANHPVPLPPGDLLNDYVPFYFTPFSPMLRNIHTGWGGIQRRSNEEIVILVSSLRHIAGLGLPFLSPTATPFTSGRIFTLTWLISTSSTGHCCNGGTSSGTRTTRRNSSATRPKR